MTEGKTKKNENKRLVGTRGRVFKGTIIKKFEGRAVIEFDRTVYIPKYERFLRRKTKIHARIPEGMQVEVGDLVRARECRPLSKIIHFIIIEKVNDSEETK